MYQAPSKTQPCGSLHVPHHLIPVAHIPPQSEAEGMGEARETEKGTPSQTEASERPHDPPNSKADISLPFRGHNTSVRVELVLRAEERSLPGSQPFYTLS